MHLNLPQLNSSNHTSMGFMMDMSMPMAMAMPWPDVVRSHGRMI